MKEFPRGGLIGKTVHAIRRIGDLNIPAHAAGCCYFLAISVFPSVVLFLAALRYLPFGVEDLMELLDGVMPAVLLPYVERLLKSAYNHSSETMVSVSAVMALWSASRGVYGLQRGLNSVYGVRETRTYLTVRGISVLYTFLLLAVLLLTLVLHVFGTTILGYLPVVTDPVLSVVAEVIDFRFFLLLILQTLFFTVLYMKLPNRHNSFRASFPGGLLASLGWLIFSDVFSIYVKNMQKYSLIFGSVYGVALCLLWLYSCISIVFFGGALNCWLSRKEEDKG